MEKETNIIKLDVHSDFQQVYDDVHKDSKMTNPIARNFAKFFQRKKDKLTIKDILR